MRLNFGGAVVAVVLRKLALHTSTIESRWKRSEHETGVVERSCTSRFQL
jgi:hypothetical protein